MVYEYISHSNDAYYRAYPIFSDYSKPHYHSDFEFLYVLTGGLLVTVQQQSIEVHPYECLVLDPNSVHSLLKRSHDTVLLAINVSPDMCKKYYPEFKNVRFGSTLITQSSHFQILSAINTFFIDLLNLNTTKPNGYQLKSVSNLISLLFLMLQELPYSPIESVNNSKQEDCDEARFERIINYITANYERKLTLTEIANLENLNVYYLSHYFKKTVGVTFQEYLSKVRLSNAIQLILNFPQLSLSEIALNVGFSDLRYMKKAFLDLYNCSISEFREKECLHPGTYKVGEFSAIKKSFDGLEDYYLKLLADSSPDVSSSHNTASGVKSPI